MVCVRRVLCRSDVGVSALRLRARIARSHRCQDQARRILRFHRFVGARDRRIRALGRYRRAQPPRGHRLYALERESGFSFRAHRKVGIQFGVDVLRSRFPRRQACGTARSGVCDRRRWHLATLAMRSSGGDVRSRPRHRPARGARRNGRPAGPKSVNLRPLSAAVVDRDGTRCRWLSRAIVRSTKRARASARARSDRLSSGARGPLVRRRGRGTFLVVHDHRRTARGNRSDAGCAPAPHDRSRRRGLPIARVTHTGDCGRTLSRHERSMVGAGRTRGADRNRVPTPWHDAGLGANPAGQPVPRPITRRPRITPPDRNRPRLGCDELQRDGTLALKETFARGCSSPRRPQGVHVVRSARPAKRSDEGARIRGTHDLGEIETGCRGFAPKADGR